MVEGEACQGRHSQSKGVEVGSRWLCGGMVRKRSPAQGERKWPQEFREITCNSCSGTGLTGRKAEFVFDIVTNREPSTVFVCTGD